jgi:hypothetical protein
MSLKNGDLAGTILPVVSIDEFKPKAGPTVDVIVVAFYLTDKEPAEDLNTFIQRGVIDTLDVEVSPNTDEEGRYLVFVEMSRNDTFPNKFQALLKDVKNVAGDVEWEIKPYLADRTFDINDPDLHLFIITTPGEYVSKDEFTMTSMKENISEFFKSSLITSLTIDNNTVTLVNRGNKIIAEVVDVGDYDTVIGRNFLSESAFRVGKNPYEANVLQNMIGNCQVLPIDKFLFVSRDDKVMLLRNAYMSYGREIV